MTRDDIIRMACEADQGHAGMECEQFGGGIVSVSTLERFAALVAAAEREACAQAAEMTPCQFGDYARIAAAIRARSQQ